MDATQTKTNLEMLLFENNISIDDFAKSLGIVKRTAYNKLHKNTQFTYEEVLKIGGMFPKYSLDYVLAGYGEQAKRGG